jgi:hypothetical protein
MSERLRLHVSIAAGPIARQRGELDGLLDFLSATSSQVQLPANAKVYLAEAKCALEKGAKSDATTRELQERI